MSLENLIASLSVWQITTSLLMGALAAFAVVLFKKRRWANIQFETGVNSRDEEVSNLVSSLEATSHSRDQLREEINLANTELATRAVRIEQLDSLQEKHEQLLGAMSTSQGTIRELQTRLEEQSIRVQEKEDLLSSMRGDFKVEMKALAGDILEEKSKKFTDQNQINLNGLITPLKEQLREFESKYLDAQQKALEGRAELKTELKQLRGVQQQLGKEAENLTKALKGDSKTQGTWGELILEKVLENSGLEKGREYEVQKALKTNGSSKPKPDAVIFLPDDHMVIVDSKASLTAYERYHAAESEEERDAALDRHVASIRAHIRGLSDKSYHEISSIQSLDFVLMFVPSEAALTDALRVAPGLFEEALDRNIGLVSPSTLMLSLRTIEHLWRSDRQNRNAQEIAERGGALYNKFTGFVEDLEKVDYQLARTRDVFDGAKNKLSIGSGNLVRQVEMLKALGAKTTKSIPATFTHSIEHTDAGEGATDE